MYAIMCSEQLKVLKRMRTIRKVYTTITERKERCSLSRYDGYKNIRQYLNTYSGVQLLHLNLNQSMVSCSSSGLLYRASEHPVSPVRRRS
jgi:hypothetical protein